MTDTKFSATRRLFILLMLCLSITACVSQPKVPPKQAIVGKWVNAGGGSIEFYANGTGFIPGIDGQISPSNFSYSFTDDMHIQLEMGGPTAMVVEIKIDGDQMTWRSKTADVAFVYTRSK
jgi:hypothetical protein